MLSTFAVCIYYRGLALKPRELQVFPSPLVGPGPSPTGVFTHRVSHPGVQGPESNLWRQHMDAELWLLLGPQPSGPWGASKGPKPIARRGWDKREQREPHPPASTVLLCLLSSWRRTHLTIIEQSSQAGPNSPPSVTHQIKVLLIFRSWDACEAGLLVHKAESQSVY